MKRTLLSLLAVAILCLIATPAMADLASFNFNDVGWTWTKATSMLTLTPPLGDDSNFSHGGANAITTWPTGPGNVFVSMKLVSFSVTPPIATTVGGTFTIDDADLPSPDLVKGSTSGVWTKISGFNQYSGDISGGFFVSNTNGFFTGKTGTPVLMSGLGPSPWVGSLQVQVPIDTWLLASAGNLSGIGAQIQGQIGYVPLPGAVLLGFLGLGAAGLKLRKFV